MAFVQFLSKRRKQRDNFCGQERLGENCTISMWKRGQDDSRLPYQGYHHRRSERSRDASSLSKAFADWIDLPADAFVIGVPITVIEFSYVVSHRVGVTARIRREDGGEHGVAVHDLEFPSGSDSARYMAAYRRWLGIEPQDIETPTRPTHRHRVEIADIAMGQSLELVTLSVKQRSARCRLLGSDREVTLRSTDQWKLIPGEIASVKTEKTWRYAGHPYLSGGILSSRLDVPALGLAPLELEDLGMWNPEEYWGEEDDPFEDWVKPTIAAGPRPEYEMEQVIPGEDPEDAFDDPITLSVDLKNGGQTGEAEKVLQELCQADLPAFTLITIHDRLQPQRVTHTPHGETVENCPVMKTEKVGIYLPVAAHVVTTKDPSAPIVLSAW